MQLQLHPTQSQVFRNQRRYRVLVAGRRWGKTWLAKAELARWIQQAGQGRYQFWYVAPTYREARDIFWHDIKSFFLALRWLAGPPNESRLELDLVTGAHVSLKGADKPDSLRGRGIKGAILDEFATMKPETWTHVIRPALSDQQGAALFVGTPQSYNHLHALYLRGQSRAAEDVDWASWQFKTREGAIAPYGQMTQAEIEAARRDMDERTFRQEYEASFESLTGRVYYAFERSGNVKPVTLDINAPVALFFDFNINPATGGIGQVQGGRPVVWREVFLRFRGGDATISVVQELKRLLREAGHQGDVFVYGDSTGKAGKTTGPSDHQVLKDAFGMAGWRIPTEQPHVKDRIAAVNSQCCTGAGWRRLVIDPSCRELIADLEQVQYDEHGQIEKGSSEDERKRTHISDALGYWLVREFPVVTPKVSVGTMRFGLD